MIITYHINRIQSRRHFVKEKNVNPIKRYYEMDSAKIVQKVSFKIQMILNNAKNKNVN